MPSRKRRPGKHGMPESTATPVNTSSFDDNPLPEWERKLLAGAEAALEPSDDTQYTDRPLLDLNYVAVKPSSRESTRGIFADTIRTPPRHLATRHVPMTEMVDRDPEVDEFVTRPAFTSLSS